MTCKDCIHYDMCGGFIPSDLDKDVFDYCREGRTDEIPDIEEWCNSFKDKSRYIELPCKVGDIVYLFYPVRKGICEAVVDEICLMKNSKFMVTKDLYFNRRQSIFFEQFGKTVFLTKEEAEAKLKERTDNG